jgi:hypothetical protein
MTWGTGAWGSSAWGGYDALALPPVPIYSSVHLGNITVSGHAGGSGKLAITQSVTGKAAGTGKVALSQSVSSKAAATATIAMSSSVKSTATGSGKLSLGNVSVKSKAAGTSSGITQTIGVKSSGAGIGLFKLPASSVSGVGAGTGSVKIPLAIVSTASPFAKSGFSIHIPRVSSMAAGSGGRVTSTVSVFGMHGGYGVVVLPKMVIVSGALIERVAYAMNTKTAQLTQYTNFDFLAIIRLGNSHYGVKPTGLYKFTGTTDNGTAIDARFTTHETDYGTNKLKNVAHVYLDSEDPSYTMAIVDGKESTEQPSSFGGRKTKLSRGTLGRWWQYRVRNKDSAKLRVASIETLVEERDRRIN